MEESAEGRHIGLHVADFSGFRKFLSVLKPYKLTGVPENSF